MQDQQGVVGRTMQLAQPICEQLGLQLWDVEFKKEGAGYVLRIFIDKEDGVDIDDCEKVSRAMDEPLDREDYIDESYCLEVSSPGLERALRLPWHYEAFTGQLVDVKLYRKLDGEKALTGTLKEYREDGTVVLERQDGSTVELPAKDRAGVKVHFDF